MMKYFYTIVFLMILGSGCRPKELTGAKLEKKLIETMKDHLKKTLEPGVEFTIKDVSYYPEKKKKYYICEFHVALHSNTKDTMGVMTALISNDFNKIERTQ